MMQSLDDIGLPAKTADGIFVAWYRVDKEFQGGGFAAKTFMQSVKIYCFCSVDIRFCTAKQLGVR